MGSTKVQGAQCCAPIKRVTIAQFFGAKHKTEQQELRDTPPKKQKHEEVIKAAEDPDASPAQKRKLEAAREGPQSSSPQQMNSKAAEPKVTDPKQSSLLKFLAKKDPEGL